MWETDTENEHRMCCKKLREKQNATIKLRNRKGERSQHGRKNAQPTKIPMDAQTAKCKVKKEMKKARKTAAMRARTTKLRHDVMAEKSWHIAGIQRIPANPYSAAHAGWAGSDVSSFVYCFRVRCTSFVLSFECTCSKVSFVEC